MATASNCKLESSVVNLVGPMRVLVWQKIDEEDLQKLETNGRILYKMLQHPLGNAKSRST